MVRTRIAPPYRPCPRRSPPAGEPWPAGPPPLAAGDRRYDLDLVARLDGSLLALQEPNVLAVDEEIDEVSQLAGIGVEVRLERRVAGGQRGERLADRRPLDRHRPLLLGVAAQRQGQLDRNGHPTAPCHRN